MAVTIEKVMALNGRFLYAIQRKPVRSPALCKSAVLTMLSAGAIIMYLYLASELMVDLLLRCYQRLVFSHSFV